MVFYLITIHFILSLTYGSTNLPSSYDVLCRGLEMTFRCSPSFPVLIRQFFSMQLEVYPVPFFPCGVQCIVQCLKQVYDMPSTRHNYLMRLRIYTCTGPNYLMRRRIYSFHTRSMQGCGYGYGVQRHFQQYFSYIVGISFIGGGNQSTQRISQMIQNRIFNFKCLKLYNI